LRVIELMPFSLIEHIRTPCTRLLISDRTVESLVLNPAWTRQEHRYPLGDRMWSIPSVFQWGKKFESSSMTTPIVLVGTSCKSLSRRWVYMNTVP
jgi:hypothetical protein